MLNISPNTTRSALLRLAEEHVQASGEAFKKGDDTMAKEHRDFAKTLSDLAPTAPAIPNTTRVR